MSRPYPVRPAHLLDAKPPEARWLVENLWADQAVGIIGGEPKCCKSFLALDLAVAVASGTPCLRRFPVRKNGRVLLYAAEDAHAIVRDRLEGICRVAGVALDNLDILVITEPSMRLDVDEEAARLLVTVERARPALLVLDPFVRLHRIDENASGEVAPILSFLRSLQQRFQTAVALVHHARKGGSQRPGQSLRGSSEFHAWGDSNLYLQRTNDRLRLTTEHRMAAAMPTLELALDEDGPGVALSILEDDAPPPETNATAHPEVQILQALQIGGRPMSIDDIRRQARMRKATVCAVVGQLVEKGAVRRENGAYAAT